MPKRLVVIDLAIENHPDGAIFIRDWLVASGKVDDAKAPHAEPHRALHKEAFVIRTAVPNLVAHRLDDRLLRFASKGEIPPIPHMTYFHYDCTAEGLRVGLHAGAVTEAASVSPDPQAFRLAVEAACRPQYVLL